METLFTMSVFLSGSHKQYVATKDEFGKELFMVAILALPFSKTVQLCLNRNLSESFALSLV